MLVAAEGSNGVHYAEQLCFVALECIADEFFEAWC